MNDMHCPECGGKLLPVRDEKTIVVCEACNKLFDINQANANGEDASVNETSGKNRKKINYIELKINIYLKDETFWYPPNGVLDNDKIEEALSLLEKAVEHNVNCDDFRSRMWQLYIDIRSGRLHLYDTSVADIHKFHKLFYLAERKNKLETLLEEKEKNADVINITVFITTKLLRYVLYPQLLIFIAAIVVLFAHMENKKFALPIISILIFILAVIIFLIVFASKYDKKNKTGRSNDPEIAKIKGAIDSFSDEFNELQSEYQKLISDSVSEYYRNFDLVD
ncbi:MAG: hypothetical protein IJM38_02780 [Ruminococcus sp.]|nr:hypothetical protein [Ruminococcus sp.]